jgi:uncharacterized protein YdeI (YjbR/CyaY-like superfamily)
MKPKFFKSPDEFREWLEKNHTKATELLVGYYKVHTGKPSLTWSQSVDVALCFGWIDGIRPWGDEERYAIRFTPRKPRSRWSRININKVAELTKAGLMRPAGLAAFDKRDKADIGYSIKDRSNVFPAAYEKRFKASKKAWKYFSSQTPSRQRTAIFWIASPKREETRKKRLETLIADCAKDKPNWPLKTPTK